MADIPQELVEQIHKGECVIFLGSDLPLGFSKGQAPPNRTELAGELNQKCGNAGNLPLPQAAEDFEAMFGRQILIKDVIDLVDNPAYRPTPLHKLITSLPVSAIISTGFDTLLEQSLEEDKKPYHNVIEEADVPFWDENKVLLLKLYGSITRPDTLAITQEDYHQVERRFHNILVIARYLFVLKPMLFVGFPLDDPTFRNLFSEVTYDLPKVRRRTYAIWENAPQAKIMFWSGRNLEVIDAEPITFLGELRACLDNLPSIPAVREPPLVDVRKAPYKYLDAYGPEDADIFYGRDVDILLLWRKLLTYRVTMLFGGSGTGKTSLLRAGVGPRLHRVGYKTAIVRVIDDPLEATKKAIYQAISRADKNVMAGSLRDFINQCLTLDDRLVLLFDQFEDFFLHHDIDTRTNFIQEVANCCLGQSDREVRFLFGLREDFLAQMDDFQKALPDLWMNNHRLLPLSQSAAEVAIIEPAAARGVHYEPRLVQQILDDLSEDGKVSPPNLQIVCTTLYDVTKGQSRQEVNETIADWQALYPTLEIEDGAQRVITADQYAAMDRAQGILRRYLIETVSRLTSDDREREQIKDILKTLVTRHHTSYIKSILPAQQISERTGLELSHTQRILKSLVANRLVRPLDDGQRYELIHEHLIEEISGWITPEEARAHVIRALVEQGLERRAFDGKKDSEAVGYMLDRDALESINKERDNPKLKLSAKELEFVFLSSLANNYEVAHWYNRITEAERAIELMKVVLLTRTRVSQQARSGLRRARREIGTSHLQRLASLLLVEFRRGAGLRIPAALGLWSVREHLVLDDQLRIAPLVIRAEAPIFLARYWALILLVFILSSVMIWWGIPLLTPKPSIDWIRVEAGTFTMGSDEGADDEKPVHDVFVGDYEIAKYEVTNGEYAACVQARRCRKPESDVFGFAEFASHPVVQVSWQDAKDFCEWIGGRLPTEAEWEKAAGWDPVRREKNKWPWGNEWNPDMLVSQEGNIRDTVAVDDPRYLQGASPYGLVHIAGNAWEWTSSLYVPYPFAVVGGDSPTEEVQYRVVRGGSLGNVGEVARVAERSRYLPDTRDSDLGFRCVQDPLP